jgi:3-dehydroquinate dehydratase-2
MLKIVKNHIMQPLILILNGPNLNLLGTREPEIYGTLTLSDLHASCEKQAQALGLAVQCLQSNHEGQLVDWLHEYRQKAAGVIINPGALTHTSIALLDAIKAVDLPVIEVHLSNIAARESFRHHSYIAPAVKGTITGLGAEGYLFAMKALASLCKA